MAVAILKEWSKSYGVGDPDILGVLCAQKLKIDVPPEIANGNVRFPAVFDDELAARTRWGSLDQRMLLIAERFATFLELLPFLKRLIDDAPGADKYDIAVQLDGGEPGAYRTLAQLKALDSMLALDPTRALRGETRRRS